MPLNRKRALSSSTRPISPPPTKRKSTTTTTTHPSLRSSTEAKPESTTSTTSPPAVGPSTLRIYSWNVNSILPLLQPPLTFTPSQRQSPLRTFLHRHNYPHILCLQEVKISPRDTATQRRVQTAANPSASSRAPSDQDRDGHEHAYTYTVHLSLPRDKFNATGFGGKVHGVATLIRNDISPITRKPAWDLEGRVLIHSFPRNLVVVNGYWPNGTDYPYRNPDTGAEMGTRHGFKLRFHRLMLEEVLRFQREGKNVLLIGDMNVAPARIDGYPNLRVSPAQHVVNRADFNVKFLGSGDEGMGGVDVFREMYGSERRYTYFSRGVRWGESCDRVDLAIVSRGLWEGGVIKGCRIEDTEEGRGHSDHVPIWVELDLARIRDCDGGGFGKEEVNSEMIAKKAVEEDVTVKDES